MGRWYARRRGGRFALRFGVSDARIAGERVRGAVAATDVPRPGGGTLPRVTISMATAELRSGQLPAELLKAADATTRYEAQKGGRNRVVLAP